MKETSTPIKCLIVEDNIASIDALKGLFTQISFLELVGVCNSAMEAIDFLRFNTVDLIISDIDMSGIDGLSLVKMLKGKYQFILISGYRKEQAVDAFDLGVVDYIWKPVTMDRFLQALMAYQDRVNGVTVRRINAQPPLNNPTFLEEGPIDMLIVRDGNRVVKVQYNDILYIQSNRYYISYYLASGSRLEEYKALKDVQGLLEGKGFWRIHNSYIVNSLHVCEIARKRTELGLHTGDKLPISRSYAKKLTDCFNDWEAHL